MPSVNLPPLWSEEVGFIRPDNNDIEEPAPVPAYRIVHASVSGAKGGEDKKTMITISLYNHAKRSTQMNVHEICATVWDEKQALSIGGKMNEEFPEVAVRLYVQV